MKEHNFKRLHKFVTYFSLIMNPIYLAMLLVIPAIDLLAFINSNFNVVDYINIHYGKAVVDGPYLLYTYLATISICMCTYAITCMIVNYQIHKKYIEYHDVYSQHISSNVCCVCFLIVGLTIVPLLAIPTKTIHDYMNTRFDNEYGKYLVIVVDNNSRIAEITHSQKILVMQKVYETEQYIDKTNKHKTDIDRVLYNIDRIKCK